MKRRTRVAASFPNAGSLVRLAAAVFSGISGDRAAEGA
jgi:hypothetical protein